MRAFIAVKIPESIRKNLVQLQQEIGKSFSNEIKFVEPENIHITLKFFDHIDDKAVNDIKKVILSLDFEPFTVSCKGLGAFPNEKFIRVVWAGAESEGKLEFVASQLNEKLAAFEFKPESFASHITLGRVRKHIEFSKEIEKYRGMEFGEFVVSKENIVLKRSKITPDGPVYTDL